MKIAVVTINYNNTSGLERTINSVGRQFKRNKIKHIVIDGGSDDKLASCLYLDSAEVLVSEKDHGPYFAMNKALDHIADTKYTIFLNSGDILFGRWFVCKVLFLSFFNSKIDIFYTNVFTKNTVWFIPRLSNINFFYSSFIGHSASSVIRTSTLLNLQGFNIKYRLAADHDLFVRAFLNGYAFKKVKFIFGVYESGGLSSRKDLKTLGVAERGRIVSDYTLSPSIKYSDNHFFVVTRLVYLLSVKLTKRK